MLLSEKSCSFCVGLLCTLAVPPRLHGTLPCKGGAAGESLFPEGVLSVLRTSALLRGSKLALMHPRGFGMAGLLNARASTESVSSKSGTLIVVV